MLNENSKTTKDKRHYYYGRARLAGVFTKLPITLLILILGIGTCLYGTSNTTPFSVSVRGYYRSDGTYVSSYHRRPPGSVAHDEPYEFMVWLGAIVAIAGVLSSSWIIIRFFGYSDEELLPNLNVDGIPITQNIFIANRTAEAKKNWVCEKCRCNISAGQNYCFYEIRNNGVSSRRHRYCYECFKLLKDSLLKQKMLRKEIYQKYYGYSPEENHQIN